jgi:hypothetical protein
MRIKRDGIDFELMNKLDSILLKEGKVIDVVNWEYKDDHLMRELNYHRSWFNIIFDPIKIRWRSMWAYKGLCVGTFWSNYLPIIHKYINGNECYWKVINEYMKEKLRLANARIEAFKELDVSKQLEFLEIWECFISVNDKGEYQYWDSNWDEAVVSRSCLLYNVCDWMQDMFGNIKNKLI